MVTSQDALCPFLDASRMVTSQDALCPFLDASRMVTATNSDKVYGVRTQLEILRMVEL